MHNFGLPFATLRPHGVEPAPEPGMKAEDYAMLAARAKAHAAWQVLPASCSLPVILAADTIVVIDGQILGKPHDQDSALAMLSRLAGRSHFVTTAVTILYPDHTGNGQYAKKSFFDTAKVTFHPWPRDLLLAYAKTDEPYDKAGGYAIQGQGAFLMERIEGAWSTVVGLPMTLLVRELLELGIIYPSTL